MKLWQCLFCKGGNDLKEVDFQARGRIYTFIKPIFSIVNVVKYGVNHF